MNREVKIELKLSLFRKLFFYQKWDYFLNFALLLFVFLFQFYLQIKIHRAPTIIFADVWLPLFIFGALIWRITSSYSKSVSQIKQMKHPFIRMKFTDKFLYFKSESSSSKKVWQLYQGFRKYPEFWTIVTQRGFSLILPNESLDDELKTFLSKKLRNLKKPVLSRVLKTLTVVFLFWVVLVFFLNFIR